MSTFFKQGTVNVTQGSSVVTGIGTGWNGQGLLNQLFGLKGGPYSYEITQVVSDTEIHIDPPYLGTNQSAQEYRIVPVQGFLLGAQTALMSATAQWNTYLTGALAGLFGDGSAGASGFGFKSVPGTGWFRKGNGDMAGQRNGTELLALEAGQVRVKKLVGDAVQSSLSDSTPGRVPLNGGHGLGGLSLALADAGVTDNSIVNGFYRFNGATVPGGPETFGYTHLINMRRDAGGGECQISVNEATGGAYVRSRVTGGWSDWKRLDAEHGSGPNGEWVRLGSGHLICTHKLAASSSGWQSWAFPAAFINTEARLSGLASPGLSARSLVQGATTTTAVDFACFIPATDAHSTAFCNLTAIGLGA